MEFINGLPEFCFVVEPIAEKVVVVKRNEAGYHEFYSNAYQGKERADRLNADIGVTKAQAAAMLTGSLFGWDVPGARPERYDENGELLPSDGN